MALPISSGVGSASFQPLMARLVAPPPEGSPATPALQPTQISEETFRKELDRVLEEADAANEGKSIANRVAQALINAGLTPSTVNDFLGEDKMREIPNIKVLERELVERAIKILRGRIAALTGSVRERPSNPARSLYPGGAVPQGGQWPVITELPPGNKRNVRAGTPVYRCMTLCKDTGKKCGVRIASGSCATKDKLTRIRCECQSIADWKNGKPKYNQHTNWERIGTYQPPAESEGTVQPRAKKPRLVHTWHISKVAGAPRAKDPTGNPEPKDGTPEWNSAEEAGSPEFDCRGLHVLEEGDGSNGTNKSNTVGERTNDVIMNAVTTEEENIDCSDVDTVPFTPYFEMLKDDTSSN